MSDLPGPTYESRVPLASGVPLGGIGTGSVELRADGRLHDWEIFNNYMFSGTEADAPPEMWPEDAMFALRVRPADGGPVVRLLYHDDGKMRSACPQFEHGGPYMFPFLRPVQRIRYTARPPFAHLAYEDPAVPVAVRLKAFTPMIPHNADDSGLPAGLFRFELVNTGREASEASLAFSLRNAAGYDQEEMTLAHRAVREPGASFVEMTAEGIDPSARTSGTLTIGALGEGVTVMPAWTDGRGLEGFENAASPAMCHFWYPFRDRGELADVPESWRRALRREEQTCGEGQLHCAKYQAGWRWRGAVCRKVTLAPGERAEVVFVMAWHFPNHYHYWCPEVNLGHWYARRFDNSGAVARYVVAEADRLTSQTERLCDALHGGTLPDWLGASLAAQLTVFPQSFWWTGDGDLTAWEGSACCQLIAAGRTIWSTWQPLMFQPALYLEMCRRMHAFTVADRVADAPATDYLSAEATRREARNRSRRDAFGGWFEHRYRQAGYTEGDFAPMTGKGDRRWSPLIGGGSALETLRDYLWTGDEDHARRMWALIRPRLDEQLDDCADNALPAGAMCGLTYDHWFLPGLNCYRATMWLGQLAAGAELARRLGQPDVAERYERARRTGIEAFDEVFWNGEYYELAWDEKLSRRDPGCLADQVSGQLYNRLCGLGTNHPPERVASALRAVRRHNCFAEEGMHNGSDPAGRSDWRYFARYSERGEDEALAGQWVTPWTGTEYFVAATMIAEGLVEEGLAVARDVHDRLVDVGMLYNHIECSQHYFRGMAAWAMLPAVQGLVADVPGRRLRFAPRLTPEDFESILLLPVAWGLVAQKRSPGRQTDAISLYDGTLTLGRLELVAASDTTRPAVRAELAGSAVAASIDADGVEAIVSFDPPVTVGPGQTLTVTLTEGA